ncbi:MAG: FISUMP domain-containing protein [Cyclobacteriaceae bacterium]
MAYGNLYQWSSAVNESKLCPVGWRVPTADEWAIMIKEAGGEKDAIITLKMVDGQNHQWAKPDAKNLNESGFSALPGGIKSSDFEDLGRASYWWTLDSR